VFPLTYFGRTNYRNKGIRFGIKHNDRFYHFYTFGKTGTGKTTLLKTKIIQDSINNHGICFFDPHGDAIKDIVGALPSSRKEDLIYLDLTNPHIEWGYNPLRKVPHGRRSLVCSSILHVFQRIWKSAWGMKMEHILRFVILTLLDQPSADLSCINKLLLDEDYRNACLPSIQNEDVRKFWLNEFPLYRSGDIVPILSKTSAFLAHPIVKRVFIENKNQLSIRNVMDTKKILLVNLAKGSVGTDIASTVGSLLMTTIASATFSRIDTHEDNRVPFFLYLDEFQSLLNEDLLSTMLSEVRKFRVGIILANQFLSQISSRMRDAILGNVGTIVCFRMGITDAKMMTQEFELFKPHDFTNLATGSVYLRMMIDGKVSKAFSADTVIHYLFKRNLPNENTNRLLRRKADHAQTYSATHSSSHHLFRILCRWTCRLFCKRKSQNGDYQ